MTKSAFSREMALDDYHILRHLFNEALKSSVGDRRWSLYATHSDPENTMLTEYVYDRTGDRIKCQSFDYEEGKYRTHIFTFTQGVDE